MSDDPKSAAAAAVAAYVASQQASQPAAAATTAPAFDMDVLAAKVADRLRPQTPPDGGRSLADLQRAVAAVRSPGDHPGVPQGAPPWETPSNPFSWSEAEVQRLQQMKGMREANRIIRQKAEVYARTMRIQMAPGHRR